MKTITKFRDEYFFLSNFYPCNITYKEIIYTNSESCFQGQKDLSRSKEFSNLSPVQGKRLGRRVNLRKDWNRVRLTIMKEIIRCKFTQNLDLKKKLLEIEDSLLIETNNWNDTYWGVCRNKGQNNLGKILMKIREEIKKEKEN